MLRPTPWRYSWKTLKIYETWNISCFFATTNFDFGRGTSVALISGVFFAAE
jgi:hypothetical protein